MIAFCRRVIPRLCNAVCGQRPASDALGSLKASGLSGESCRVVSERWKFYLLCYGTNPEQINLNYNVPATARIHTSVDYPRFRKKYFELLLNHLSAELKLHCICSLLGFWIDILHLNQALNDFLFELAYLSTSLQ